MTYLLSHLKNYALLMRLHRPVGILLLLWPTLWAVWIAAQGSPSLSIVIIFILGVVLMRSAGCIVNDFADRKFDGKVARTKERPLVTGTVSIKEAILLFACLCLIAFILVLFLNCLSIFLAAIALLLAMCYPFMKRYIQAPQVILGLAFSWGIPMAFAAETNTVPVVAWLLFFCTCLWVIIYDTQYAMADREDDLKIGIRSTAILFGNADVLIITFLQVAFLLLLAVIGMWQKLGIVYFASLIIAAGFFIYQIYLIKDRDPQGCFAAFNNNQWVGLVIFLGVVFGFF
ncbi:4-hydroxybenzoate octaprenyltransferase [soil metagenome]